MCLSYSGGVCARLCTVCWGLAGCYDYRGGRTLCFCAVLGTRYYDIRVEFPLCQRAIRDLQHDSHAYLVYDRTRCVVKITWFYRSKGKGGAHSNIHSNIKGGIVREEHRPRSQTARREGAATRPWVNRGSGLSCTARKMHVASLRCHSIHCGATGWT